MSTLSPASAVHSAASAPGSSRTVVRNRHRALFAGALRTVPSADDAAGSPCHDSAAGGRPPPVSDEGGV
ncbi:hypothetical protein GCM10027073_25760 [Streptomyces chlorus]